MLSPEQKKYHQQRHEQVVALVRERKPHLVHPDYSEDVWENTLSELTAGEYDGVVGLRLFIAELVARSDRQAFIDQAATRLCQIARNGSSSRSDVEGFARVAYDQAEALWRERQNRRNRNSDETPF